jgi:hypothetical protein
MEAYDVPGDQLEADVISFAMALLQQGLILSAE